MKKSASIREIFAKNLRENRRKCGFSQEKLAELAGLHRTYISDLERGQRNPTLTTLVKIAQALSMTVSMLLVGVDNE